MNHGNVISVRVGAVRTRPAPAWDRRESRTWQTAYQKDEVAGAVHAGALGFAGDQVFSTDVHGGVHMAVLAYAAGHYPAWQAELARTDFGPGAFGENLTVEHWNEDNVCIGDEFTLGSARLQVSQPRGPCNNISLYWDLPHLLKRVSDTQRTGWYLRVLAEGPVERGQRMTRVAQPHPALTVRRALSVRADTASDPEGARLLVACAQLSPEWRTMFESKLAKRA